MSQYAFRDSARKVKGPAIGLLVLGSLGMLAALVQALSFVFQGFDESQSQLRELLDRIARDMPSDSAVSFERMANVLPIIQVILLLLGALASLLAIGGGYSMLRLRNYGVCIAACIVAAIPFCLPCCACVLGLPIGIWGLIVLLDDEVRDAFRGIAPVSAAAPVVVSDAPRPWSPPGAPPPPPPAPPPPPPTSHG